MAGYTSRLRTADHDLQPFPPLVAARHLAGRFRSLGGGHAWRAPGDRQLDRKGASLGCWRKRGAQAQAIGRSRGGLGTKVHGVVDGVGRLIAFTITAGQVSDHRPAPELLAALPAPDTCLADGGYDSDRLRMLLIQRGTTPVIPNRHTRKRPHPFDPTAYRSRNLIERMFCRLKDWRRIATRYDKLATNYASTVAIAAIVLWWT